MVEDVGVQSSQVDSSVSSPSTNAWGDAKAAYATMGALAIILGAPLWPRRNVLSPEGVALHDAIVDRAKEYAKMIVAEEDEGAFAILCEWATLANRMLDATKVVGRAEEIKLLAVFTYYADASGVDWSKIVK